jgi:hypothetical protein
MSWEIIPPLSVIGMVLATSCEQGTERTARQKRGAAMKEQMMGVIGYLVLGSVPLLAAAVMVMQLIIGYGEPVQVGSAMGRHKIRKIKRNGE